MCVGVPVSVLCVCNWCKNWCIPVISSLGHYITAILLLCSYTKLFASNMSHLAYEHISIVLCINLQLLITGSHPSSELEGWGLPLPSEQVWGMASFLIPRSVM